MAKINGTIMTIYSGSDLVLLTKNCTLNVEQDLPDATTKDSAGWAEHINGLRNWSVDFDGAFEVGTSNMYPGEIVASIIARTADTVIKFGTSAAAATGWTGNGTFKSISISAPMEDVPTFSGTIVGNGALAAI